MRLCVMAASAAAAAVAAAGGGGGDGGLAVSDLMGGGVQQLQRIWERLRLRLGLGGGDLE